MPRYRFASFVISPRRRLLTRDGQEQPIIPRYFDLLVFLIEHRHEAVNRRQIFDSVWADVIVSDNALSQAIRTIRRTLGEESQEPRFIRTVSRHGYRFVFAEVVEEDDIEPAGGSEETVARTVGEPAMPAADAKPVVPDAAAGAVDPFEPLLERVTRVPIDAVDEEDQREAAEMLHHLGTVESLRRLGTRPGHARARALLRDARWESAEAGAVPLLGTPDLLTSATTLVRLRLRRLARLVLSRSRRASLGGGLAGMLAGAIGGLMLVAAPGSQAPPAVAAVLAAIGAGCGAIGGMGVGAGLSIAEAVSRSQRMAALVAAAALGGGLAGLAVQLVAHWSLAALVGLDVTIGGGLEGVTLGGAAGLAYALGTRWSDGGLATPRGWRRFRLAGLAAVACGAAALALTLAGRPLAGGTIHRIAQASHSPQATLQPLGRLVGEPDFGPLTRALIGTGEGALFGFGLAFLLTRRP